MEKTSPRELDLTPEGLACLGGELRTGCAGTVLPEIHFILLFPSPIPASPTSKSCGMCEFTGLMPQVGVRSANPLGRGEDANPSGRSGLVPGMCPYLGLWARVLWTEAALCSRMLGEGAEGAKRGGRREEHFESTAWR